MYEKELQRILNASQNNALTFFVGAGVSALSGAPTWKALIHAISDKLGRTRKDEYSSDENLQIPQMFYYSLLDYKRKSRIVSHYSDMLAFHRVWLIRYAASSLHKSFGKY